jgi:hypothetical protein
MLKPAEQLSASRPTIDDAAACTFGARPCSIEERRRAVAKFYPQLRVAEIAELLGWSGGTIGSDIRALGISEKRGRRRRHPVPEPRQCPNHEDPRCSRRDAGGWFTPTDASQVTRGRARFCGTYCARTHASSRATARRVAADRHARADAEIDRICAAKATTTIAALAAKLGVAENTLNRYLHEHLQAEKLLVQGEYVWFIPLAEAQRFERENWPALKARVLEVWTDRPFSSRWNSTARQRWGGRRGGAKPPAPGGAARGRPRGYTKDQAQHVRESREREGRPLSIRAIARTTGLSKWQVEHILAAEEVSGKPS